MKLIYDIIKRSISTGNLFLTHFDEIKLSRNTFFFFPELNVYIGNHMLRMLHDKHK